MLSVAEAQERVLAQLRPLPAVSMTAYAHAVGLVLAEDVASDLDMPPYDKALMDGYAVRAADLPGGAGELDIIEEVTAGRTPRHAVGPGQATRIMTGAPVPAGADAVIMVEQTETLGAERVRVRDAKVAPGVNVLPRGREMRTGEVVLRAGTRLRPQEIGLLATVGRASVRVHHAPTVGVLATGDELVEPDHQPGPGQIRNSNALMLRAQVYRAGGVAQYLGIARDTPQSLRDLIRLGLEQDVLLLTGGVSAGTLDLVPGILAELGVQALFHQVRMKPGKPVLFGIKPRAESDVPPRLVFGLPGNPVSALVCFELFVRPALRGLMALEPGPTLVQAALTADFASRNTRPTYHPARLSSTGAPWQVEPVPWFGSPDLRGVCPANAFVVLPEGEQRYRAGDLLPVLCVEESQ